MTQTSPAVHRTILVVDAERFGDLRRTNTHQVVVREGMYGALRQAFDESGIGWDQCEHEDRGDGVFVRVPTTVPKSLCSEKLPLALVNALRAHNATHSAEARIRLRLALHAGEINYDAHGVTSIAVNHAFRLLEAEAVKAALRESPGVLAVVASRWFYDEVIRQSPASNPASFRQVHIMVKETSDIAWIALPDHPYPSSSEVEPVAPGERPDRIPPGHHGHAGTRTEAMPIEQFYALVEALESVPCLRNEDTRAQVVDQLPSAISGAIRHYPQRRAHVVSILRSCLDYDGGVEELLKVVSYMERERSASLRRLLALLRAT